MRLEARRRLGRLLVAFGCGGVVCGLLLMFAPSIEPFLILFPFAAIAAAGASTTLAGRTRAKDGIGDSNE